MRILSKAVKELKAEQTYAKLIKKLDKVFSIFIRKRDKGKCFTCSTQKPWKEMDAGHYKKRQHLGTRWDERNVNCQDTSCNSFKGGNMDVYAIRLEAKYGYGILQELEELKKKDKKYKTSELEKLIKKYSSLTKEV